MVALTTFITFTPGKAHSTAQTIETQACNYSATAFPGGYWACPVAGGDWISTNGPGFGYVDFYVLRSTTIKTVLSKKTTTGTYYTDSKTATFGAGARESYVMAVNSTTSPNLWDYYYIHTEGLGGDASLFGMAVTGS
jgi:hypothetical protein